MDSSLHDNDVHNLAGLRRRHVGTIWRRCRDPRSLTFGDLGLQGTLLPRALGLTTDSAPRSKTPAVASRLRHPHKPSLRRTPPSHRPMRNSAQLIYTFASGAACNRRANASQLAREKLMDIDDHSPAAQSQPSRRPHRRAPALPAGRWPSLPRSCLAFSSDRLSPPHSPTSPLPPFGTASLAATPPFNVSSPAVVERIRQLSRP